jgi:hypothetical protein
MPRVARCSRWFGVRHRTIASEFFSATVSVGAFVCAFGINRNGEASSVQRGWPELACDDDESLRVVLPF